MVEGAGKALMTGAVSSTTWITWDAMDSFPQSSAAVQVLVTVYSPAHGPGTVLSSNVMVTAPPHASTAIATSNTGIAGHCTTEGAGKAANTGASASITWIVCAAVAAFPHISVANHVLVVIYSPMQSL